MLFASQLACTRWRFDMQIASLCFTLSKRERSLEIWPHIDEFGDCFGPELTRFMRFWDSYWWYERKYKRRTKKSHILLTSPCQWKGSHLCALLAVRPGHVFRGHLEGSRNPSKSKTYLDPSPPGVQSNAEAVWLRWDECCHGQGLLQNDTGSCWENRIWIIWQWFGVRHMVLVMCFL